MKRNLLQGIILIGAVALSSCSVNNKLASTDDDVYNNKAKAGDQLLYADNVTNQQNNYNADDDYYYYGDYASRINRFSYNTPFDYDDDFYYNYAGYNAPVSNTNTAVSPAYDDSYTSNYNFADIYSPYDYGYYDFGGYDDWGYGSSYSFNLFSGGGGGRRHNVRLSRATSIGGSRGPSFTRSNSGRSGITRGGGNPAYTGRQNTTGVYPGRPTVNNSNPRNTNTGARAVRPERQDVRPAQPVFTPNQAPSFSSPGNSGGGGGGASSNGGGGRPVRP